MLNGDDVAGWLAHFGLKCSSWTPVNAGTSSRSACASIGNTEYESVKIGNCLGSRNFKCIRIDRFWNSMSYSTTVNHCIKVEPYFFPTSKDDTSYDGGCLHERMHLAGAASSKFLWVLPSFPWSNPNAGVSWWPGHSFLTGITIYPTPLQPKIHDQIWYGSGRLQGIQRLLSHPWVIQPQWGVWSCVFNGWCGKADNLAGCIAWYLVDYDGSFYITHWYTCDSDPAIIPTIRKRTKSNMVHISKAWWEDDPGLMYHPKL